jgi:8-oxo-dGTP diphosphatase
VKEPKLPSARRVDAVVAVIERNGRYLLGKRSLHKASAPGYWTPVTGRIEPGESERDALVREVAEETGLAVTPRQKLGTFSSRDQSANLHWYEVELLDSNAALLANDEHDALVWVDVAGMRELAPMFPEDLAFFEALAAARVGR